jgi:hypothetical protein
MRNNVILESRGAGVCNGIKISTPKSTIIELGII